MTPTTRARARRGVLIPLVLAVAFGACLVGAFVMNNPGGQGKPSHSAVTPAAAAPPQPRRVLNIVAHHDDDLLFLSPGLIEDIRQGAYVRTLFFVASDYVAYPRYMIERERGVRNAYAVAAGLPATDWRSRPYSAAGVQATLWTLGERLSILETRVPDGYRRTPQGAKRLWPLYADGIQVSTRAGDTFPVQTLGRSSVVGFLRALVDEYRPAQVNTLDPYADLNGAPDHTEIHQDHIAVARLTMYALGGRGPNVSYYRDYSIGLAPANLTAEQARLKTESFGVYTAHDPDAQRSKTYPLWLQRTYLVDDTWRHDLVVPLPPPAPGDSTAGAAGPWIGVQYRIVNRRTGQALQLSPGDQVVPVAAHGDVFLTSAVRNGWTLATRQGTRNVCLTTGARLRTEACAFGRVDQVLRVRGNPTEGFRLVATNGEMLTASPGGPVFRPADTAAAQIWDFVPVS